MEEAIKAFYSIRLAERIATASEVQDSKNCRKSAWSLNAVEILGQVEQDYIKMVFARLLYVTLLYL
jgi:hypothetical protein